MDGQVKLPGSAAPISFKALPIGLRIDLGRPTSSQVWRVSGGGDSFLYLLNYEGDPDVSPRVCGVASEQLDYAVALDALELHMTGKVSPKELRPMEWISPQNGYQAIATKNGKLKVLQINWLTDAQRKAAARVQEALRH